MIQTNTFSANRHKLAQHGQEHLIWDINTSAVELARRVVLASFKDVLIAGMSVRWVSGWHHWTGPTRTGVLQAFAEQIEALSEAGGPADY